MQDGLTIPVDLDRKEFFSVMEDFIGATNSGMPRDRGASRTLYLTMLLLSYRTAPYTQTPTIPISIRTRFMNVAFAPFANALLNIGPMRTGTYIVEPVTCQAKLRLNNTKPLDLTIPQYDVAISLPSIPIVVRGMWVASPTEIGYCLTALSY
jgi:hypothetical protein